MILIRTCFSLLWVGIFLLGWVPLGCAETLSEDKAYQTAIQYFNQQQWQEANDALRKFKNTYPKSRWKYAVQLRLADLEKNPERAIEMYRTILDQAASSEWAQDARWGLAVSLFVIGSYNQAVSWLGKIEPKSHLRYAQALYLKGLSHMALKQFVPAQVCFQTILEKYSDTQWASLALAGSGETAMLLNNHAEALTTFDRYLREYPEGDMVPTVLMLKSKVLKQTGMGEESTRMLHELVTRYTESFDAEKANSKLSEDRNKFTIQVGAFSKKEYAQKLVKKLRTLGYNAYVLEAKSGTEIFNQVRVGSYTTREFSDKIGKQLAKKEKLPYIVLPYIKPDIEGK
jgi:outer membrane protein assembly factor BamD (BamD/ComL family)